MRAGRSSTDGETAQPVPDFRRRLLLGTVSLAVLVALYFILAATIPRWWSQRVGEAVNGHLWVGLVLGVCIGLSCTLLPLTVLWLGLRQPISWKAGSLVLLLALLIASPNLWTLGVITGDNSASRAGSRVMDVRAPFFRGATLAGAIMAAALFLGFLIYSRRRRRRTDQAGPGGQTGPGGPSSPSDRTDHSPET